MKHILLDTSVILAFSRSQTGGSAFIIECCEKGIVQGYISRKVVDEAERNARGDMGAKAVEALSYIFTKDFLRIVPDGWGKELEDARTSFNNEKDAPIIAAAKQIPRLSYILSLDNGFFKPDVISYAKPIEILKPGTFIQQFRKELEK